MLIEVDRTVPRLLWINDPPQHTRNLKLPKTSTFDFEILVPFLRFFLQNIHGKNLMERDIQVYLEDELWTMVLNF